MRLIFADTFYYLALLNIQDAAHVRAVAFSNTAGVPLMTTAWVLTELADGLCRSTHRRRCGQFIDAVKQDAKTTIVPPSSELFEAGLQLYQARPDKDWSLTDCISFVVMNEQGVTEALTADHHFEQAGFTILLK